ncbi:MAG: threonine/serine dehydratase [Ardenticatenaceae bacterium]|nr:threonine/serine dehydratase [Ardenticatenaceae bacterium]
MLTLKTVAEAQGRLRGRIRRTPLLQAVGTRPQLLVTPWLKLEHLQVTGSFKVRGALNTLLSLSPDERAGGVVTASGGNHGLGVAYAAAQVGVPATVFLPESSPPVAEQKLRALGASVRRHGRVWDDAWIAATAFADERDLPTIHPFDGPTIWAGQATVAAEILEDLPQVELLLVAIGGGGLIGGIARYARLRNPAIRIIGVEPRGAPSMRASLEAGSVVTLPAVQTIAHNLAPRAVSPNTLALAQANVDEVVLVDDNAIYAAMRWLWEEFTLVVEPSGAAALAALLTRAVDLAGVETAVVVLCGSNVDGSTFFQSISNVPGWPTGGG